jgi:hypothetical protein
MYIAESCDQSKEQYKESKIFKKINRAKGQTYIKERATL